MALLLKTDDKQQWRMAMNNEPFFATHSPEGFLALRKATAVDAPPENRIRSVSKTF
jgi:catalase